MRRKEYFILTLVLFCGLFCSISGNAQSISAPVIDTPLTTSKTFFYNGEIVVPYQNGSVGISNNAEIEILSTTEVTLLPGFTASVDSGCGEFVGGIQPCPMITINAQVSHISCNGKPDGRIRLLCNGGNEPYMFNWTSINKITQSISGLSSGVYSVIVTDQTGCTESDSITIIEPTPISVVSSTTPSECHESSGSVTVLPAGGVGNYSFYWEKDGYSQANRNELAAGLYEIIVTDSNHCLANVNALISDSDGPDVNVEIVSTVSCHGYNDASAIITGPSIYPAEPVFPCGSPAYRLAAGQHPVMQEDENGCITLVVVNIDEPDPLEIVTSTIKPECGNNNGTILAQVSGGTEPYSYTWSNNVVDSINDNLYSGIHSLTVVDGNGCSTSKTIFLADTNSFDLSITKQDVRCNKSSDGIISVSVLGGVAPYAYRWFDDITEIGYDNAQIEFLPTGHYSIFVSDANNCMSVDTISILYPEDFDLQFETINPSNDSAFDGSIVAYLSGGTPPYQFDWSNEQSVSTINSLAEGTYSYSIRDQNDCVIEGDFNLLSISGLQQVGCSPSQNQLPFYADAEAYCNILGNCSTLTPNLTELNIRDHFGAIPNDGLNDQQSFEWASEYIRLNYCSLGPVKLIIPPGTYIVGRQDSKPYTYLLGYHAFWFCDCPDVTIEGQIDPITGENPKIQFENCLKYGSFDPVTHERLFRNINHPDGPMGAQNGDLSYAADVGYMLYAFNCENFNIYNIDFDGNIDNLTIGGYYASDLAGINRPNGGMRFDGCLKVVISNCTANNFGQDGLIVRHDGIGRTSGNMDVRILQSRFNHNCRAGFHWNGGSNVFAEGCEFNYNGFGPWGGTKNRGGLEMEIDAISFADLAHGKFINCEFMFNSSASIIGNGLNHGPGPWDNKHHNFFFKGCKIAAASRGYASYLTNQDVTFKCCDFAGQVFDAYDATNTDPALNLNTKFISCSFDEELLDPVSSSTKAFTKNLGNCATGDIGELSWLVDIENEDGRGRVLFDNCKINAARYCSWAYLSGGPGTDPINRVSNKITIRNTEFSKVRGDKREPTLTPGHDSNWNKYLLKFIRVIALENNQVYLPHSDPANCYCNSSTGTFSNYPYCWQASGCLATEGVESTLKIPKGSSSGYCGDRSKCFPFYPDGYTDASYHDPQAIPCLTSPYLDPPFTSQSISIWPSVLGPSPCYCYTSPALPCTLLPPLQRLSSKKRTESGLQVYPIPANNFVHILNSTIGENVYLYNIMGKIVQQELIESADHELKIHKLSTGVYYLKTNSGNNTVKIIKTNN